MGNATPLSRYLSAQLATWWYGAAAPGFCSELHNVWRHESSADLMLVNAGAQRVSINKDVYVFIVVLYIIQHIHLKVSFTEKPFNSSSFRNTIAHSKLHMHAARENDLLPPLPALANERKYTEKQADQKEPFFVT